MTILYIDKFEVGSDGVIDPTSYKFYNVELADSPYPTNEVQSQVTIQSLTDNTKCVRLQHVRHPNGMLTGPSLTLDYSITQTPFVTTYVGVNYAVSNNPNIESGTELTLQSPYNDDNASYSGKGVCILTFGELHVFVNPNMSLSVGLNGTPIITTAPNVISSSTFSYIELEYMNYNYTDNIKLFVNHRLTGSATSLTSHQTIKLGWVGLPPYQPLNPDEDDTLYQFYDDIYISNSLGNQIGRPGPVRIAKLPILDSTEANFDPINVDTNKQAVNKDVIDDSSYNSSPDIHNVGDFFSVDVTPIPEDSPIVAVQTVSRYKTTPDIQRDATSIVRYDGNQQRNALIPTDNVYTSTPNIIFSSPIGNPNSQPLDKLILGQHEFGYTIGKPYIPPVDTCDDCGGSDIGLPYGYKQVTTSFELCLNNIPYRNDSEGKSMILTKFVRTDGHYFYYFVGLSGEQIFQKKTHQGQLVYEYENIPNQSGQQFGHFSDLMVHDNTIIITHVKMDMDEMVVGYASFDMMDDDISTSLTFANYKPVSYFDTVQNPDNNFNLEVSCILVDGKVCFCSTNAIFVSSDMGAEYTRYDINLNELDIDMLNGREISINDYGYLDGERAVAIGYSHNYNDEHHKRDKIIIISIETGKLKVLDTPMIGITDGIFYGAIEYEGVITYWGNYGRNYQTKLFYSIDGVEYVVDDYLEVGNSAYDNIALPVIGTPINGVIFLTSRNLKEDNIRSIRYIDKLGRYRVTSGADSSIEGLGYIGTPIVNGSHITMPLISGVENGLDALTYTTLDIVINPGVECRGYKYSIADMLKPELIDNTSDYIRVLYRALPWRQPNGVWVYVMIYMVIETNDASNLLDSLTSMDVDVLDDTLTVIRSVNIVPDIRNTYMELASGDYVGQFITPNVSEVFNGCVYTMVQHTKIPNQQYTFELLKVDLMTMEYQFIEVNSTFTTIPRGTFDIRVPLDEDPDVLVVYFADRAYFVKRDGTIISSERHVDQWGNTLEVLLNFIDKSTVGVFSYGYNGPQLMSMYNFEGQLLSTTDINYLKSTYDIHLAVASYDELGRMIWVGSNSQYSSGKLKYVDNAVLYTLTDTVNISGDSRYFTHESYAFVAPVSGGASYSFEYGGYVPIIVTKGDVTECHYTINGQGLDPVETDNGIIQHSFTQFEPRVTKNGIRGVSAINRVYQNFDEPTTNPYSSYVVEHILPEQTNHIYHRVAQMGVIALIKENT